MLDIFTFCFFLLWKFLSARRIPVFFFSFPAPNTHPHAVKLLQGIIDEGWKDEFGKSRVGFIWSREENNSNIESVEASWRARDPVQTRLFLPFKSRCISSKRCGMTFLSSRWVIKEKKRRSTAHVGKKTELLSGWCAVNSNPVFYNPGFKINHAIMCF